MKKILAALTVLAGIVGGIAYAATGANPSTPAFGDISTSPVVVCGSFDYNGGPQVSTVSACGGTFTANGTTAVTVTNANVTANSVIVFGINTVGGTPAGAPYIATVTPGTGFTVKAAAGDTSVYNYIILG